MEAQAATEANLDGQRHLRRPTWKRKGCPEGRLGRRQAALRRPKALQEANLEAERRPRRATWEAKGRPGRQLGVQMERTGCLKEARKLQK